MGKHFREGIRGLVLDTQVEEGILAVSCWSIGGPGGFPGALLVAS